ncbi:MAG: PAS domain S-box protein [SAR324 cluster bacterium]|nr:PAS domain S-box protein [SAR324 cluster bacterium]
MKHQISFAGDERISQIMELVIALAAGNLEQRGTVSDAGDELDAILGGLNMLAEELMNSTNSLKAARNYYENIIKSMVDTLIVLNAEAIIQTVNPATLALLGYEEKELVGTSFRIILDDTDTLFREYGDLLNQQNTIHNLEINYVTKEHRKIPMLFSASVIHDDAGNIHAIACVAQDITQRKEAEIKLQKFVDALMSTNKQLQETQTQLVQSAKLASIGELATGVAHELNQPLAYLRNISQLRLQMGPEALTGQLAYETFEEFVQQTDRMRKIINHLRNFARHSPQTPKLIDLPVILESSFTLLNEQFRLRNIEVKWELAEGLPQIMGNASQLEQVFINLLSNARDALDGNPESQVVIQTEHRPQPVGAGEVVIRFKDNGCGIPREMIDRIFDPFFTTKEVGKGTGLGLSISYGIVKEHQGTITVSSKKDQGTVFELSFPCPGP